MPPEAPELAPALIPLPIVDAADQAAAAVVDLDRVLAHVAAQVAWQAGADRTVVVLVDPAGEPQQAVGFGCDPHAELPGVREVVARVVADPRPWLGGQEGLVPDAATCAATPLLVGDQVVGVLYVDRAPGRPPFDAAALSSLGAFAGYATLAIHNGRMYEAMADRLRKQQVVNEVSQALGAAEQLDHVLRLILGHALSVGGAACAELWVRERGRLACLARAAAGPAGDEAMGPPVGPSGLTTAPAAPGDLVLDLVAGGAPVGQLVLSGGPGRPIPPQDLALLESMAGQAALAVRNAQLLRDQDHQLFELDRALQLVHEAQTRAVTDGLTGLYNHVYFKEQLGNALLEADRYGHPVAVLLVDLDHFKQVNDTHGHQAGDQVLVEVAQAIRRLIRDCDVVARYGGEEIGLLLPQTDGPGALVVAERIREAVQALEVVAPDGAHIPVTASVGVAGRRSGQGPDELVARADQALYAAKRAGRNRVCGEGQAQAPRHGREVRQAIQEAFLVSVEALCQALEVKDHHAAGHAAQVRALAGRLGTRLGLSGRELEELELAAALHDVGKIGVPDAILRKEDPLDDVEQEVLRTHPVQGDRILRAGQLPGLAVIVRHHHERWDGSGYPDGLVGQDIPLASRLVAVLDAFGAMTAASPGRRARDREGAIAELEAHAGSQFDPAIVATFVEMLRERG